jgi:phytoene dehydrogenase-like protein
MPATDYDAIVIGSGMGGLTVASLLAQLRGKRVLLVERHFKLGGFTHSFRRQQFHWDVGLHYVGEMGRDQLAGQVMRLVTGNEVDWQPMPELFERFVFPDFNYDLYAGRERFVADLSAAFPAERAAISVYLRDVERAAKAFRFFLMQRNGAAIGRLIGSIGGLFRPPRWALSTKDYLEAHIRDPRLKAVLAAQWGDYGLPPGLSPFTLHALIVSHYLRGAYYPRGGAGQIAEAVKRVVEAAGGATLVGQEAIEIIVHDGRAVGVKVRKSGSDRPSVEYRAPIVVSNVGAAATYARLVPAHVTIPFRQALASFAARQPGVSDVTLYVGLKEHPGCLGFRGENHWLFAGHDHDVAFANRGAWIDAGAPPVIYLSFPSLKDPDATAHTADLIAWAPYERFAKWRDQPWRNRDDEYLALKARLSRALLDAVERHYPGFSSLVAYQELSTPLTSEHFTGHAGGAIYGLPAIAERFRRENLAWSHPRTPIAGLYLTGADVGALGIVGAMFGGVTTLSHLSGGVSTPALIRAARASAQG